MEIGEKIKLLRNQNGMSQSDLAAKSDISRVAVGNYERGDRIPTVDVAKRIATTLGVTVNDLLNTSDLPYGNKGDLLQEGDSQLIYNLNQFTPDEKMQILSSLNLALDYLNRAELKEKPELVNKLCSMIFLYGQMLMNSYSFRYALVRPDKYFKLLNQYDKLIELASEYKKALICKALETLEDNSELKKLISGDSDE